MNDTAIMKIETAEYLTPVGDVKLMKRRLEEFQDFVKYYLVEGEDYGPPYPGSKQRTLLKPGADKLCELYGLADAYPDDRKRIVENWDKDPALFDYSIVCVLTRRLSGIFVTEQGGSCNSWESKYRYRDAQRRCPVCKQEAIIKGKDEYGGGWVCFKKKGGCGAKFSDGDSTIESQTVGKIPNPDIADVKNTVEKIAYKRAKVAAVIAATRSSGIFTQDMEDLDPEHMQQRPTTTQATANDIGVTMTPMTPSEKAVVPKTSRTIDAKEMEERLASIVNAKSKEELRELWTRIDRMTVKKALAIGDKTAVDQLVTAFDKKAQSFNAPENENQETTTTQGLPLVFKN